MYQRWVSYVNLYELLDTTFLYFIQSLTIKKIKHSTLQLTSHEIMSSCLHSRFHSPLGILEVNEHVSVFYLEMKQLYYLLLGDLCVLIVHF